MLSDLGPGRRAPRWRTGRSATTTSRRTTTSSSARSACRATGPRCPTRTLEQSPRRRQFVMPPNPTGHAAALLAEGAAAMGYEAYPYPAAVNSEPYDGRPACNSCGLCSGFGCPINARGDALVSWLNPALRTGRVRVVARAFVHRIETNRRRPPRHRRALPDVRGRAHRLRPAPWWSPAARSTPPGCCCCRAARAHPDGLGNRLRPGRPEHDVPQLHPGRGALPTRTSSRCARSPPRSQVDDLVGPFTGPGGHRARRALHRRRHRPGRRGDARGRRGD